MSKYIEKEVALEAIHAYLEPYNSTFLPGLCTAITILENTPIADVTPVMHGRWISYLDGDCIMPEQYYRCSKCKHAVENNTRYCPHCGTKMDLK